MLTIRAAFDASMEHPCGITAIAGYIADAGAWAKIEAQWNECLDMWHFQRFHFTDVLHNLGNERGWDCINSFAGILHRFRPRYVCAYMRDTDWDGLEKESEYRRIYPQRQHACLDMLLGVLAQDADLEFKGEKIAVAFDNDYGNTEDAARVYENWRARTRHPGFSSITFIKGEMEWDIIPLQCADLAAGLIRLDPFTEQSLSPGKLGAELIRRLIATRAMRNGRGAMWSIELARHTEKLIRKARDKGQIR